MDTRPHSTRREFLQGKAAVDALAGAAWPETGGLPGPTGPRLPEPSADGALIQLTRRAMACQFEIFLNAGQYSGDTTAGVAALDLVDRLEDQLSIYRESSEISRLNRQAAETPVTVEPGLFALLSFAQQTHTETAGAYDVTAGPLSHLWGFTRRQGVLPSDDQVSEALERIGSQHLLLDEAAQTVRFAKPGVQINLGSIGKGYALDRAADLLSALGVEDFLLHGGNSSVLARGAHSGRGPGGGWSIGVRNPLFPDRRLGELRLNDRALATSGSGTQFFVHAGRRFGHILDPRTGWPAEGVLSTTVLAPTAAAADALSTAFYVMGPEEAASYCLRHPEVAAILIAPGRKTGSLKIHHWGLDDGDWTAFDADERSK